MMPTFEKSMNVASSGFTFSLEPMRFNAIRRRLGDVTHKTLTETLRRLERNRLVTRRVLTASVLGVEYSITPLGRSLQEPCAVLAAWAAGHAEAVLRAQRAYDGRETGSFASPA